MFQWCHQIVPIRVSFWKLAHDIRSLSFLLVPLVLSSSVWHLKILQLKSWVVWLFTYPTKCLRYDAFVSLFMGSHFAFLTLTIIFICFTGRHRSLLWWNFWCHWRSWMGKFDCNALTSLFPDIECSKWFSCSVWLFVQMETQIRNSDELAVKIPNTQVMLPCLSSNTRIDTNSNRLNWNNDVTLAGRTKNIQLIPHTALPSKTNSPHKLRRCF